MHPESKVFARLVFHTERETGHAIFVCAPDPISDKETNPASILPAYNSNVGANGKRETVEKCVLVTKFGSLLLYEPRLNNRFHRLDRNFHACTTSWQ